MSQAICFNSNAHGILRHDEDFDGASNGPESHPQMNGNRASKHTNRQTNEPCSTQMAVTSEIGKNFSVIMSVFNGETLLITAGFDRHIDFVAEKTRKQTRYLLLAFRTNEGIFDVTRIPLTVRTPHRSDRRFRSFHRTEKSQTESKCPKNTPISTV